jgi:hypothetical protein
MRAVAGRGDDGRREVDCERAGVGSRRAPCADAGELIGNALTVPEVETPLSNMEAELSSRWPDVCYVYLTTVAARRPDGEESTYGGDGTA